jgi:hypothetical protein
MGALAADPGPLLYNGGPIMQTTTIYPIFWIPSKLQTGGATGFSKQYAPAQIKMLNDYVGHGLGNNNTQYSQTSPTAYVQNKGGLGGYYVDTTALSGFRMHRPSDTGRLFDGCADPDRDFERDGNQGLDRRDKQSFSVIHLER